MTLYLNESHPRSHFKKLLGQANHFIITVLVGLDAIERKIVTKAPAELHAVWSPNWIESAYNNHSQAIRRIKNQINEQTAHANIFNSQHNFLYVPGKSAEIHTSYFDFEDDEWVKVDIWRCANAGLIAIDLLLAVQKQSGGFLPSSHADGLADLITDNDTLFQELNADRLSDGPT